jgi:hypothetical protein
MSDSESEYWAKKLGLSGDDSDKAKRKLMREFEELDGLGSDFLDLFEFMDELPKPKKLKKKKVTNIETEQKEPEDTPPVSITETPGVSGKYIPPHARGRNSEGSMTTHTSSGSTVSLVGLLNRVSEGNLDSISMDIITLITKTKASPKYVAESIVTMGCDNPHITVTLQGTFAGIVCAIATDTAPSTRYPGAVLVCLVSRISELLNSAASTDRVAVNYIRFVSILFSLGLFSFDVVRSVVIACAKANSNLETRLDWVLTGLRFSGRVMKDKYKSGFSRLLDELKSICSGDGGRRTEFQIKELSLIDQSGFRAVDHLQTVCEWLSVRSSSSRNMTSSGSQTTSTLSGWRVPQSVESAQLIPPCEDVFACKSWPKEWIDDSSPSSVESSTDSATLEDLARMNRMTTDLKKNSFIAIMGAVDADHALIRLDQFGLLEGAKSVPSIVSVVCHCALQEKSKYNPFYGEILVRLCGGKKSSVNLESGLQRKFKMSFKIELRKLITSGNLNEGEVGIVSELVSRLVAVSDFTIEDIFA